MRRCVFDNQLYLKKQITAIQERAKHFSKLYLECGGKLLDDQHACRVLPGYEPDTKVRVMQSLGQDLEVIICVSARDIECKKQKGEFGPTYDILAIEMAHKLRRLGLYVQHMVITHYAEQISAQHFQHVLENQGFTVTLHRSLPGYPHQVDFIVSSEGFGSNPFIQTQRPIVVVTAPGPGSGKLGTALNQIYHELQHGNRVGYAKLESFPVWNLPLDHPLNMAYEAATAELNDRNMIDPFHLQTHNEICVNYNRDIDAFPVLRILFEKLTGVPAFYASPTEMGVNRIKDGIMDEELVCQAAKTEIIARYYDYTYKHALGQCTEDAISHLKRLLFQLNLHPEERAVVAIARQAALSARKQKEKGDKGIYCAAALQLADGSIVTGKNSPQLHAASALILNSIKKLAGIDDAQVLLPEKILQRIAYLKQHIYGDEELSLDLEEMLIALSSASQDYPYIEHCMTYLSQLRGAPMHLTRGPTAGDTTGLRKLGIRLTCDPQ